MNTRRLTILGPLLLAAVLGIFSPALADAAAPSPLVVAGDQANSLGGNPQGAPGDGSSGGGADRDQPGPGGPGDETRPGAPGVREGGGSGGDGGAVPQVPQNPNTGKATPRVMLTAFTTEPAVVQAGDAFRVTFALKNMSKKTRVSNLKVTLTGADGALLPNNGSSSTYIETIKPGGTVERTMDFSSLPSLEDRPYQMTMLIEYEDPEFNALSSQENVSVIVQQQARAAATPVKLEPQDITVGQEASLTFSVNNLGKSKMYNARVKIAEGQGLAPVEHFIGTIEPGASSSVDLLVSAVSPASEQAKVVVSYENAEGQEATIENAFDLAVAEESASPSPEQFPGEVADGMDQSGGFSVIFWILPLLLLAAIILVVILVVRSRRKRKAALAAEMKYLDDPILPGA